MLPNVYGEDKLHPDKISSKTDSSNFTSQNHMDKFDVIAQLQSEGIMMWKNRCYGLEICFLLFNQSRQMYKKQYKIRFL